MFEIVKYFKLSILFAVWLIKVLVKEFSVRNLKEKLPSFSAVVFFRPVYQEWLIFSFFLSNFENSLTLQ